MIHSCQIPETAFVGNRANPGSVALVTILGLCLLLTSCSGDSGLLCAQGTKQCAGTHDVQVCSADGEGWEALHRCENSKRCSGGICVAVLASCNNGKCEAGKGENCNTCPADCGRCCGNNRCEPHWGEDRNTCEKDCRPTDGGVKIDGPVVNNDGPIVNNDGPPLTKVCTPNAVFCQGTEVRVCNPAGTGSTAKHDCKNFNFGSVMYNCGPCQGGGSACTLYQSPNKNWVMNGGWHPGYNSNLGTTVKWSHMGPAPTCNKSPLQVKAVFDSSNNTTLNVYPKGPGVPPYMELKLLGIKTVKYLVQSSATPSPDVQLKIVVSPTKTCTNLFPPNNLPYSKGTVKLSPSTPSGKKGDPFDVSVKGYVRCVENGKDEWADISAYAHGVFF